MSLPSQFQSLMDNHGSTLQNMALLAFMKRGEEARPYLQATTAALVCNDVLKYLNRPDPVEAARQETILNIAKYVKTHPRARPHELQLKVEEEIELFKKKIKDL